MVFIRVYKKRERGTRRSVTRFLYISPYREFDIRYNRRVSGNSA